ncbi:sensor histidine kinase [Metallumcola ferriviriculae]|uniref:Oxygen sensor histidine kinase NreB n=1 Tax=Metallumcola ferriviriculae TaxID=3039180 RepID=A0AAU0UR37_9FIRM|nr:sensor histidine kinase [Desulfitibacteraceae bacterium MK1]
MNTIFEVNLLGLYFLYGLSFYTMGLAIALQYRSYSSFRLASSLSLLAAFGLFHGLSEWGSVFVPFQVPNFGSLPTWKLIVIQRLLQAVSHFFLFLFGIKLISDTNTKRRWLYFLPFIAMVIWLLQFIRFVSYMGSPKNLIDWLVVSESWSRYILAFPGGILAAYGLALQVHDVKKIGDRSVLTNLFGAIAALLFFAFFSGLVIPQNVGGLSRVLNAATFKAGVGLPVEFFRTGTAFMIAWCITSMLSVFELEKQRQLDESHKVQAVLKERERFARDLHDDVIQVIYGIGINLQIISQMIAKNERKAFDQLNESIQKLNLVIANLRRYIHQLEYKEEYNLVELLSQAIKEIGSSSPGIEIKYDFDKLPERIQPAFQVVRWEKQVQQIVREALHNVVRHARASRAEVSLIYFGDCLKVTISDDGRGISKEEYQNLAKNPAANTHKRGLYNMRARTELLQGSFMVKSSAGKGTTVAVTIPLQNNVNNSTDVTVKGGSLGSGN